jgi:hypothetical protein
VLQTQRVRRIIASYTVNRLGTWFALVALALSVFDHTHSALAVAGMLFAWTALPAFAVPAVVARMEISRHPSSRSALSGLYFFEALATAALAGAVWHFWLPAVLLLAALDGTAALAASALLRAELARVAREHAHELEPTAREGAGPADAGAEEIAEQAERKANAALNLAFSVTFVIGPVIGGGLVAAAGAPAALLVDVASFLICSALLLNLRPPVDAVAGESVMHRLRAALRHINEAPTLRALLIADAVAFVFFEAAGPIEVTYVKATLHAGDGGYGLLLTIWGAGAVLGSLIFARSLRRPLGAFLTAGTAAVGLAYVGFAAASSLLLACPAALLGGIGNGLELPSLISIVQRLTPQHLQGRLMGATESIASLCVAIGLPLGGALTALSSPRIAFLAVGVGATATALPLFRLTRRSARTAAAGGGHARTELQGDLQESLPNQASGT